MSDIKIYHVKKESVKLHMGTVLLTEEQAEKRAYGLEENSDGTFSIVSPVSFKQGEVFGSDQPVPKGLVEYLEEASEEDEDAFHELLTNPSAEKKVKAKKKHKKDKLEDDPEIQIPEKLENDPELENITD